jgi:hypothetical protein
MPSIVLWNRLEPQPRSNSFGPSLAARVRDPAWFLCRQWQTGEFTGQDVGSPAFVTIATTTSPMKTWSAGGKGGVISPDSPLEKQALAETFSAKDLSLAVEIGQTFRQLLTGRVTDPGAIYDIFRAVYPITPPPPATLDPLDQRTSGFLAVCAVRALDGAAVYALAKRIAVNADTLPPGIPDPDADDTLEALTALIQWVQAVWGDLGEDDPPGWVPDRLEQRIQVQALAPDGTGVTFDAHPDSEGELPWSSFDVLPVVTPPPAGATTNPIRRTIVPGNVRFRSIASPRFWDFETNDLSLPDVKPEITDVNKVLTLDFLLIHGTDWMVTSLPQELGMLTRVDALVVTDVFGGLTVVDRADTGTTAPGPNRWTLFAPSTPSGVANFFVSSPTAGPAVGSGRVIEDVRFARDEMVNMAWAIERATESPVGVARPGPERDAAVDEIAPIEPGPSDDTTSPLRYQVETKVPVHWIPLVGVPRNQPPSTDPSIILQRAFMLRPNPDPNASEPFVRVDPLGKIMNPDTINTYRIIEEEVPRAGLVVDRAVYRSRWIDGSTHLWIARRRRTGSGETASALRFDVALPTNK